MSVRDTRRRGRESDQATSSYRRRRRLRRQSPKNSVSELVGEGQHNIISEKRKK